MHGRNWGWFRGLALAAGVAVFPVDADALVLDETEWAGDAQCSIRAIYFYEGGEADIDFGGEDDYDFGYWWLDYSDTVVIIEFEFYFDTFIATYDGTTLRAAHAAVFSDEQWPQVEYCSFTRAA